MELGSDWSIDIFDKDGLSQKLTLTKEDLPTD